jgi:hypothetical protein
VEILTDDDDDDDDDGVSCFVKGNVVANSYVI